VSVHTTPGSSRTDAPSQADEDRGYAWVIFAGLQLLTLGTLTFVEGIAAIGNAHFFVSNAHFIVGSLNAWGWVVLCFGVLQFVIGLGVFVKSRFSRWAGWLCWRVT
jgi:hypothetical protein